MTTEAHARELIDAQLAVAAWVVQDVSGINLSAARGVAVREVRSLGGPADYILFVDGKAIGVVDTKKAGITLSTVAEEYSPALARGIGRRDYRKPRSRTGVLSRGGGCAGVRGVGLNYGN